jgi:hypothetical protein
LPCAVRFIKAARDGEFALKDMFLFAVCARVTRIPCKFRRKKGDGAFGGGGAEEFLVSFL